jgi:hypothetical protein
MKFNSIKTKSEGPIKLSSNTVNFCYSFGQDLTNFHPFFMAWIKVGISQPVNFCFPFRCFWKLTTKFRFLLDWFKISKFQTWQWRKFKKSISQLPKKDNLGRVFFFSITLTTLRAFGLQEIKLDFFVQNPELKKPSAYQCHE